MPVGGFLNHRRDRKMSAFVIWHFCGQATAVVLRFFLTIPLLLHNCVSVPCSGLQVNVCVDFE